MPRYGYRASDPSGSLRNGVLEAPDRARAARALQQQGLMLLELEEIREARATSAVLAEEAFLSAAEGTEDALDRRRSLWSRHDRAVFLRQLAMMFSAGIHLVRALGILASQAACGRLRTRLQDLVADLEKGASLGMAMQMSCLFNTLQVGTVKIGEENGRLGPLLTLLARLEEHEVHLRRRLQAQLSYPASVLVALVVGVAFLGHLMGGVLRQFTGELAQGTLAQFAAVVLSSGWFPVTVLVAPWVLPWALSRLWRWPATRPRLERLFLKLPALGPLLRRMEAARLCRLLGILAASGIQVDRSLSLCRSATSSPAARQALLEARVALLEGATFSEALERGGFFGREVLQMTAAGEVAGRLSTQLMKVADYSEREVERFLEAATAALEPLLISLLGSAVAVVMLLTFGPIYGVIDRL